MDIPSVNHVYKVWNLAQLWHQLYSKLLPVPYAVRRYSNRTLQHFREDFLSHVADIRSNGRTSTYDPVHSVCHLCPYRYILPLGTEAHPR